MTQLTIRRKEDGKVWKVPEELKDFLFERVGKIYMPGVITLRQISFYDEEWNSKTTWSIGEANYWYHLDPALYEVLTSQEENERLRAEIEGLRELHEREMSSIHEAYVEAKEAYESEHSQNFLRSRGE